jgi:hypothetical protein
LGSGLAPSSEKKSLIHVPFFPTGNPDLFLDLVF